MSLKRRSIKLDTLSTQNKRKKSVEPSYLQKTLDESGLILKEPPEKSVALHETIQIIRNIKKNLEKHFDYPRNASEFFSDLTKKCQDINIFKHYLFPNIVKMADYGFSEHMTSDSVIKILLSITILQPKLIDYIFCKATDLAVDSKCMPWIQMILKCLSSADYIVNSEAMATHLINLLDVASEKNVRLEIITAIPDIIGDQEHNNVADELCRILGQEHDLIPALLDCLSYLCLSDEQYEQVQKKALNILQSLSKCSYFPNFVKVLLMPGRMNENGYLESVQGLRNTLGWPTTLAKSQEIASSQFLTATAIRSSMISSKLITNAWLKVISKCKICTDHKPFDFVIILIIYSTSEERQRQVENLLKKKIVLGILKEDLLEDVFEKYKPILKDNLKHLMLLTNVLLKAKAEPVVQSFASHTYMLILSHLEDYCSTVIAELLQLGLDCKQVVLNILVILNKVASKDISLLKPQCSQMLTLLDRLDDMSLTETRAVMNLLSALAYSYENSLIRDDIHMIIRKELGSSNLSIKTQGILAGIHAVKYLMASNSDDQNSIELPDNINYSSVSLLSEGNLREAAQIIEIISKSTRQFPEMIVFFYDELCSVLTSANKINKHFLMWLSDAVTNDLQQNFIVDSIELETVGELKLSMQYCLNNETEVDDVIAINIAGLALKENGDVSVEILSPLFKLVQTLHFKQYNGNLSSIDALLGCPIVMPKVNIEEIEDMETDKICSVIDCLLHCVNWFRELLNAFASSQNDDVLRGKMLQRVNQIEEIENLICQVLLSSKVSYKQKSYLTAHNFLWADKRSIKPLNLKQKSKQEHTVLPETIKSQGTQKSQFSSKNQHNPVQTLQFRKLNHNLLYLLCIDIEDNADEKLLTIKSLKFILKSVKQYSEEILISKIKKQTFLSKQEDGQAYDRQKAEECANSISKVLPNLMSHMHFIATYLHKYVDKYILDENEIEYSIEAIEYLTCLEYIYNMFTIYFKWIGFKNPHSALLKSSLMAMAGSDSSDKVSLNDCVLKIAKNLQKHEKCCVLISVAMSLVELLKILQEHCTTGTISKIISKASLNFLSTKWKTVDGALEKGLIFNQSVGTLASTYLMNNEIDALKTISLELVNDVENLKGKNDALCTFQCINKNNFTVLYRNLGNALCEVTKSHLNKGLTNSEHLALWRDVTTVMKCMTDISKRLENRHNLSAFFQKSLPIIKLFISHGLPILEIEFKKDSQEIVEILKLLQQSTRFLQSLCCHSRLKKDTVLMSKVPFVRQLLETLVYRVKAVLVANNCSEAFWMGNLKNKNIHGKVIQSQQSVVGEESVEDCDDILPEDEECDDSDEDMLDLDSKGFSDIV